MTSGESDVVFFFFSSRRRHTICYRDWSSDVCSSDLESGLLKEFMPELLEGYGVGQNLHHIYTVWEHNLKSLECAIKEKWLLDVRVAALLHDVGKPRAKRGDGKFSTFYGHDIIGAKIADQILSRLRFPT